MEENIKSELIELIKKSNDEIQLAIIYGFAKKIISDYKETQSD